MIEGLRHTYSLSLLLDVSGIARSTFYYYRQKMGSSDKYKQERKLVHRIFHAHKGRYGYRRITLCLREQGYLLNHKTVLRLMNQEGLKSTVRPKKYRFYKTQVHTDIGNLLHRDFTAKEANQKWEADVTEFALKGNKLFLSPIMDMYNGEIISYTIGRQMNLSLIIEMMEKAFKKIPPHTGLILHSDQGHLYKHPYYMDRIKKKGIIQSMSAKGNPYDNAPIESFFALLKTELFYLQKFSSIKQLEDKIHGYIKYYNQKRIKVKLNGLSPVKYRTQNNNRVE